VPVVHTYLYCNAFLHVGLPLERTGQALIKPHEKSVRAICFRICSLILTGHRFGTITAIPIYMACNFQTQPLEKSVVTIDQIFDVADRYASDDDDDLCEPLVRALEDSDEKVRQLAVEGLVMLDDLYASSSILWTLLHGSRQARTSAATVLGRLRNEFAIPYLEKALEDKDACVRKATCKALKQIRGKLCRGG
jgi:hypothetical protein